MGGDSRIPPRRHIPGSRLVPQPLAAGRPSVERSAAGEGRPTARWPAYALGLLASMGLHRPEHVYHQIPAELSGGMLQRVLIAIAISCNPDLIVADEATTALDVTTQSEVVELLRRLKDDLRMSVLFVSHDHAVVAQLCDRIVVFYAGEVVEVGRRDEIISSPRHPYTEALLRVGSLAAREDNLEVIPGQPPHGRGTPFGVPVLRTLPLRGGSVFRRSRPAVRGHPGPLGPLRAGRRAGRTARRARAAATDRRPLAPRSPGGRSHRPPPRGTTGHPTAGGHRILDEVSLEVHQGQIVGVIGETGSGKTTWRAPSWG